MNPLNLLTAGTNGPVPTLGLAGLNKWMHSIWFKPGNSDLAPDVDWMFMFILWVSIISFIILMVPMCWWAFKYRRRPGVPAIRTPNHNLLLEITWVVVPLIIVTYMFFEGFRGYMKVQVSAQRAEEIYVTGKKWNWKFTYPNDATDVDSQILIRFDTKDVKDTQFTGGNIDMPLVIVPAGKPVRFKMISEDVIHSFFIPDMRVKMDVMPNRYTSLNFTPLLTDGPDGAGIASVPPAGPNARGRTMLSELRLLKDGSDSPGRDHYIYCAEYCGKNHSEMAGVLRVVSPTDYAKIIAQWKEPKLEQLRDNPVSFGEGIVKANGCFQCHSIDGSRMAGGGPTWKNAYGYPVKFQDGSSLDTSKPEAWDNYIRESILNPTARIHEGYGGVVMSRFQLSEDQLRGVIFYFRSLSDKGNFDGVSAEARSYAETRMSEEAAKAQKK